MTEEKYDCLKCGADDAVVVVNPPRWDFPDLPCNKCGAIHVLEYEESWDEASGEEMTFWSIALKGASE